MGIQPFAVSSPSNPEISFLCLFSIICFGRELPSKYQVGSKYCTGYQHVNESISLICPTSLREVQHLAKVDLHTLAFEGSELNLDETDLCNLNFKHLILNGVTIKLSKADWACSQDCKTSHSSVTIYKSKNIGNWDWGLLSFDHLHVEESILFTLGSDSGLRLPYKLRTLSYVSCSISELPKKLFHGLVELKSLTIIKNPLKQLTSSAFPSSGLPGLWFLDLSSNQIKVIEFDFKSYFPNLMEVNLQSNQIQVLHYELVTQNWNRLRLFNIEANDLHCPTLCWAMEAKFHPHPILFDAANCYDDALNLLPVSAISEICEEEQRKNPNGLPLTQASF